MRYPKNLLALGLAVCASFVSAVAASIEPVPPQASARVAAVQVRVSPDHRDWSYQVGEQARFKVTVVADNEPLTDVAITYTVGPELMPASTKTATVPLDGLVIEGSSMKLPGFLRCTVMADVAGKKVKGVATAAFSPEKIVPTQIDPADFDAFWQSQKARLAEVPFESRRTLLPEWCTDKLNVYQVSFTTLGGPEKHPYAARIYGILCEPKAPGKYPAVLKVPGAHIRPYFGEKDLAERGVITLEIGITGIPVNLPKEVYDMLDVGPLNCYWTLNMEDREAFYYNRVILGCLRANDYLTSLENWDGKNLLVMGASQGGMLTIATAALDPRVTALAATHPAFCDLSGDFHGRAGGWPHPFQPDFENGKPSPNAIPAKIATATYYDTVNFARRVKVPGYYTWGYNDDVCPPTSMYAAYNVIKAPKELGLTLELSHSYTPEQREAIFAWVFKALGVK
jgi:cephalosporin-C deacetylase-like acetyl esterase